MIRFWRVPFRKVIASENELVSPADGKVIYIRELSKNVMPVSVKNGIKATLEEFAGTNLLQNPCWQIGINMTLFDVHKNCAPAGGEILLTKHIDGEFLSLKNPLAIIKNERNTIIICNKNETTGIVQTASHLVRRIDCYINQGDKVKQGDWIGMIRFGSQVDVIFPGNYIPSVRIGEHIYAKKTILARK
ncbi:MAG TPA: phosphatidylserine decarboxylase [Bacteroidales bacterium]|nr:phosphatidylserine decarboxylase family protein [Bacteroidales bacterium]HQJ21494.1 phosphatidylserine decarboxylase [Bacteroidales bacterium]